jgi:hypothetical protein
MKKNLVNGRLKLMLCKHLIPDIAKIKSLINWKPKVNLDAG